jgi:glycosyltransferase involved in cell wall biosynthesis
MIYHFFIIFFWTFSFLACEASERKVCLNMIVKNESQVITRCLESVKPLIDYWVIVDTGSDDGTQQIIKEYLKDIPGELHERPWLNFSHNRNEALQLAMNKGNYILFMDADDTLVYPKDYRWPSFDKDCYYMTIRYSGSRYFRIFLIRSTPDWNWVGILHEAISSPQIKSSALLEEIYYNVNGGGNRSQDPQKFLKDAKILEEGLISEPNNSRYVFYLAQSYKDAQVYDKALLNYEKRVGMGDWDQEIFYSMYQVGLLQETMQKDPEVLLESYKKAYSFCPSRVEPLYRIANYQRQKGNHQEGYNAALLGLSKPPATSDALFIEQWIYDYGLLLEFSICAYWLEKYSESLLASQLILSQKDLPENVRTCVENNLAQWIKSKLIESLKKDTEFVKANN